MKQNKKQQTNKNQGSKRKTKVNIDILDYRNQFIKKYKGWWEGVGAFRSECRLETLYFL